MKQGSSLLKVDITWHYLWHLRPQPGFISLVVRRSWPVQGGSVRALFVDFSMSKAFDRVHHNILFAKLKDHQMPHCLIRWIHSYLSCRRQTLRVDNHYSDLLYLTAGMPQGSRPGPLTFLLLVDNLSTQCLTHKCRWYHPYRTPDLWLGCKYYADLLPTVDRLKQHANKLFKDQGNDLRSLGQAFISTSILQFWLPT